MPFQVMLNIVLNALLNAVKWLFISYGSQLTHISLGKILVLVPDIFRSWNKFDIRLLIQGPKSAACQIVKGSCFSRSQIVESIFRLIGFHPKANIYQVFDIDEIALLLSVFIIRIMRLKELHLPCSSNLLIGMKDDRCHSGFMILIRAIDIKKFQTTPERRLLLLFQRPFIKIVFRMSIGVQWLQAVQYLMRIDIAFFSQSIGRCRRSIDQAYSMLRTNFPNCFGVVDV